MKQTVLPVLCALALATTLCSCTRPSNDSGERGEAQRSLPSSSPVPTEISPSSGGVDRTAVDITYQAIDDVCETVDMDALGNVSRVDTYKEVYDADDFAGIATSFGGEPADLGDLVDLDATGSVTSLGCYAPLEYRGNEYVFSTTTYVYEEDAPVSPAFPFDLWQQTMEENGYEVSEVIGLADEAVYHNYSSVTGPTIALYDDNLSVRASLAAPTSENQPDLLQELRGICQQIMIGLRA